LPKPRQSLQQRLSGPNRKAVRLLIAAAEAAVETSMAGFGDHARLLLGQIGLLARGLTVTSGDAEWRHLYTLVHDFTTSSATVGWKGISSVCAALERTIEERDPHDPKMIKVVALHCDALQLLLAGDARDRTTWQGLIARLGQATRCLPRKGEPAEIIPLRK
jgi:hypothetical protein